MTRLFERAYRRLFRRRDFFPPAGVRIGDETFAESARFEIRSSSNAELAIVVGERCVLQGTFVIERAGGVISIGNDSFIGASVVSCASRVSVGSDVLISWGCTVLDHDSHSIRWAGRARDVADALRGQREGNLVKYKNWQDVQCRPVVIQDKVWIGCNVTVLCGVTIGEGAVVGAGSVVTKDVPAYHLAVGNPCRVVKQLDGNG